MRFFLLSWLAVPVMVFAVGCDTSNVSCYCYGPSVSLSVPEDANLAVVGGSCSAYTSSCERIPDGGEPSATCGRTTILIQASSGSGSCEVRLRKSDELMVSSTLTYSVRPTDCCPESTVAFEDKGEALRNAGAVIH